MYRYHKGDYESMRLDALKFEKEIDTQILASNATILGQGRIYPKSQVSVQNFFAGYSLE